MQLPGTLRTLSLAIALVASTTGAVADLTGTWQSGSPPVALELHERADGTLLGYMLGGDPFVVGQLTPQGLTFSVDGGTPAGDDLRVFSGTIGTDTLSVSHAGSTTLLTRTTDLFSERRFLVLPVSGGGQPDMTLAADLRVAEGPSGLLGGVFEGRTRCDLFSCGGDVTRLVETPATDRLELDLAWSDGCPGTAIVDTTWDAATSFYLGTYQITDCAGPRSGNLAVVVWTGTRSDHVADVLATLGALADDMEAGTALGAAHPSVAPDYLHGGTDEPNLLASLAQQGADWNEVDVELTRFATIHTVQDPRMHPFLHRDPGADFHDQRSGVSIAGGPPGVFRQTADDLLYAELRWMAEQNGDWVLFGDQDAEAPGIVLPFTVEDVTHEMFGAWPFGAHGGGHPEGHPGIDFEFHPGTTLLAARAGTITDVSDNALTPDQVNVELQSGDITIRYHHVDATLAPGIFVGATVATGQPIGGPGEYCCDPVACCDREGCAPGGEATCCGDNYPNMGTCDPASNPDYHHLIHFGVSADVDSLCPWDLMNEQARAELESLFLDAHYAEQLTEPFLCNDPERSADAMPYITRWDRTTDVSASNPAAIVFTRTATYGDPDYQFLDDLGAVLSSGIACANDRNDPTLIEFVENGNDCHNRGPGTVVETGYFELPGGVEDGTLRLDLLGGGLDVYAETILDTAPAPCGTTPAAVGDLRLDRAGSQIALSWTEDAAADDYVVFESAAPDGRFDLISVIEPTGSGSTAVPLPARARYYLIAPASDACGVELPR